MCDHNNISYATSSDWESVCADCGEVVCDDANTGSTFFNERLVGIFCVLQEFLAMLWKDRVTKWADDRNLIVGSVPALQMSKLAEEVQELSDAILRDDCAEICDAIGDIQVVLAVMCAQLKLDIDECREIAWEQIKDRKGKMVDGVFVKEAT